MCRGIEKDFKEKKEKYSQCLVGKLFQKRCGPQNERNRYQNDVIYFLVACGCNLVCFFFFPFLGFCSGWPEVCFVFAAPNFVLAGTICE